MTTGRMDFFTKVYNKVEI